MKYLALGLIPGLVFTLVGCDGTSAYQEYNVRSEVSSALAQASSAKIAVSEHILIEGGLPSADDVDKWAAENPFPPGVRFDIDKGVISIDLLEATAGEVTEGTIYLEPSLDEYLVSWNCYAENIQRNLLPASCR